MLKVVSVEGLALESDGQDFRIRPLVLAAFLHWFYINLDLGPAFHRPGAFYSRQLPGSGPGPKLKFFKIFFPPHH